MEGKVPGEEEHQIRPNAGVGAAGDAGEARGEQAAALEERERVGGGRNARLSPSPRPLLYLGDEPPNRIIRS